MAYLFNFLYLLFLLAASPWLVYRALTTGKYRRGLGAKFLGLARHPLLKPLHGERRPLVWFHGVSVGEIHLLRHVIGAWRKRHPEWRCVVSTTTDTGFEEARKNFPDLPVIWWPLDFSWAVVRVLDRVRPDLVVLAEAEVWPNFLRAARKRGIPVSVINGRMSPRSFKRFQRLRWLVRPLFSRLDLCAAQTAEYAEHFRALGASNVHVTGSVKYDGAAGDRNNPRTQTMRQLLGVGDQELVWVAGSTQAPEEEIVLGIYRRAQKKVPHLRLILVPRQKDRFDEVADLLKHSGLPFRRRSESSADSPCQPTPIILLDTIGELGAVWGLAEVAYVGGSLDGKRGGQNMIEPAAYGAAVLFGPHVWNFKETVTQLLKQGAAIQIADAAGLEREVHLLLANPGARTVLGQAARRFVLSQQGATERTLQLVESLANPHRTSLRAA